jgi:hypothetical protein
VHALTSIFLYFFTLTKRIYSGGYSKSAWNNDQCRMVIFRLALYHFIVAISYVYIDLYLLGMYLASLSRDHTKANPLQVSSGVILEIFLFIGTFFLNWVRTNYPKGKLHFE